MASFWRSPFISLLTCLTAAGLMLRGRNTFITVGLIVILDFFAIFSTCSEKCTHNSFFTQRPNDTCTVLILLDIDFVHIWESSWSVVTGIIQLFSTQQLLFTISQLFPTCSDKCTYFASFIPSATSLKTSTFQCLCPAFTIFTSFKFYFVLSIYCMMWIMWLGCLISHSSYDWSCLLIHFPNTVLLSM